jgi:hypothetical protein
MKSALALIALVALVCPALAQTVDIDKLSKADFEKLSLEQRGSLPMLKSAEKFRKPNEATFIRVLTPLMLRELQYGFREAFLGSDKQIESWVKQFQSDLGEPPTGVLTVDQFETLSSRSASVRMSPIYLPSGKIGETGPNIFITDGYASVEGTWVIEGDEVAHPLNVANIKCYRKFGHCFQIDVEIDNENYFDNTTSGSYHLATYDSLLPIMSWTDQEIVLENNAECRNNTITINAKAKEVYEVSRNNGGDRESCELPQLEQPRTFKLVEPYQLSRDYFAQKQKEAFTFYSKEYREYVEALKPSSATNQSDAATTDQPKTSTAAP